MVPHRYPDPEPYDVFDGGHSWTIWCRSMEEAVGIATGQCGRAPAHIMRSGATPGLVHVEGCDFDRPGDGAN